MSDCAVFMCALPQSAGRVSLFSHMHAFVLKSLASQGLRFWPDPSLVFRMQHCFGGTCIGVVRGTVTHFMLAVLSWWEISGVSPSFLNMRMG